jgi:hypothetical protein
MKNGKILRIYKTKHISQQIIKQQIILKLVGNRLNHQLEKTIMEIIIKSLCNK